MNNFTLFTTAIVVSLDSFFCGLSTRLKTNERFTFTLGIILSVFTLCLLGSFFGESVGKNFLTVSQLISGYILIFIAFLGFFKKDRFDKITDLDSNSFSVFIESIVLGLAIGLDGGVGCFSITLVYGNRLFVAVLVTLLHLLLINLSILITCNKIIKKISKYQIVSQIILLLLGVYKIITF